MIVENINKTLEEWLPSLKENKVATNILSQVIPSKTVGTIFKEQNRIIIPGKSMTDFTDLFCDEIKGTKQSKIEYCSSDMIPSSTKSGSGETLLFEDKKVPEYEYYEIIQTEDGYLLTATHAVLDQLVATREIVCSKIKMGVWAYSKEKEGKIKEYIENVFERRVPYPNQSYYEVLDELYKQISSPKYQNEIELNLAQIHPISIIEEPFLSQFTPQDPAIGFEMKFTHVNLLSTYEVIKTNIEQAPREFSIPQQLKFKDTLKEVDHFFKATTELEQISTLIGTPEEDITYNLLFPTNFDKESKEKSSQKKKISEKI